jgi:hypothetical protein
MSNTIVVISADHLYVDSESIVPIVGMCFNTGIGIDALGTWLGAYLYNQSRGLKYMSSNSLSHTWGCKSKNCGWEIKFTKSQKTLRWKIKRLNNLHVNCTLISQPTLKMVSTSLSKLILSVDMTPGQLLTAAKEFGIKWGSFTESNNSSKVSSQSGYHTAWRILNQLRLSKIDSFEDGYGFLASYLKHLKFQNPNCVVSAESNPRSENQFVRAFIMLRGQAVCASNCKPIISYDGGFLKVCFLICQLFVVF